MTDRLLVEVAAEVGITYRQADSWCACGYVRAEFWSARRDGSEVRARKGSGTVRRLPPDEERVLRFMARLVHAGLDPSLAARLARTETDRYVLAPGVVLTVEAA